MVRSCADDAVTDTSCSMAAELIGDLVFNGGERPVIAVVNAVGVPIATGGANEEEPPGRWWAFSERFPIIPS